MQSGPRSSMVSRSLAPPHSAQFQSLTGMTTTRSADFFWCSRSGDLFTGPSLTGDACGLPVPPARWRQRSSARSRLTAVVAVQMVQNRFLEILAAIDRVHDHDVALPGGGLTAELHPFH